MQPVDLSNEQRMRVAIVGMMADLLKHKDKPPDGHQMYGFVVFTEDIPLATFKAAAQHCIDNLTWYPAPAEFREAAWQVSPDRAPLPVEAWSEIKAKLDRYKKPEYSHPAIMEAVQKFGYMRLCNMLVQDEGNEFARFTQVYNQLLTRARNDVRQALTGNRDPFQMIESLTKSKALPGVK